MREEAASCFRPRGGLARGMTQSLPAPDDVLSFWFEATPLEKHFKVDPALDAEIGRRFRPLIETALAGRIDDWAATADGALASILVLDQFTRNTARGTPAAYGGDRKALTICKTALSQGFDQSLTPYRALFLIMPLMHSENLADQERCVELIEPLDLKEAFDAAVRHREIVARFGRFPHRNAVLGRKTTAEEAAFLKEPNSSF